MFQVILSDIKSVCLYFFLKIAGRDDFAPSFKTSADLINRIENLPDLPRWQATFITLPEAPNDPQLLFYRNPVECLAWLEANPDFSHGKDYVPYEEYLDSERLDRCYSEMASGLAWNEMQHEMEKVDPEITIHPFILTSDTTHLTNFSGDKKAKPLLITSAHIQQHIRAAPSRRAYFCTAFIPEGKFLNLEFENPTQAKELPGILSRRLYHICMRIILQPLREHIMEPRYMVDSEGYIRKEVFRMATYIGDLPEQVLVAGLSPNQCVNCIAGSKQLGDPHSCRPRTGLSILQSIATIHQNNPHCSTWKFAQEAKKIGLNGVDEPWWIDWPELDICRCVAPDVLHGLHKAFKDHCSTWNTNLVGKLELDARFKRQPKYTGFRHFSSGISKISQWSGKEHRDLQRHFLVAIAGHSSVPPEALRATRAGLDFIYLAQYRSHTESTLVQLMNYNAIFHQYKDVFIKLGARRGKKGVIHHFNIPKLHTHHHYPEFIRSFGGTGNFCTEASERYHIEYAKKAYRGVSRNNFAEQMVRWLDRREKLEYFNRYLKWRLADGQQIVFSEEDDQLDEDAAALEDGDNNLLQETPLPIQIFEPKLAIKPRFSRVQINKAILEFQIHHNDFMDALKRYEATLDFGGRATGRGWAREITELPSVWNYLDIWTLFRIKLPVLDELHDLAEQRILRALPMKGSKPSVLDVVFIDMQPEKEIQVGIEGM